MTEDRGFLGFLPVTDWPDEPPDLGVLGVPRPGASDSAAMFDAPNGLRRAGLDLEHVDGTFGVDLGNLDPAGDHIAGLATFIARAQVGATIPIILGGGEADVFVVLASFPGTPLIAVSHRMRGGTERTETLWLGLNGPQPEPLWRAMAKGRQTHLTARAINAGAQPDWPKDVVLWLDAAALDIGHAAGAVENNPGGIVPDCLIDLFARWGGKARAIIVTGAAPGRDPRGLSELALAAICQKVLCHV